MRLLISLFFAFFKTKLSIGDKSETNFYCTIGDGAIRHMRAHRYNNFFNPSLYTLFIRSGKWLDFIKNRMAVVYTEEHYYYLKMIKYGKFQTFTQIIHFDNKYFYVKIDFFQNNILCAKAYYKMCFVNKGRSYPFMNLKEKIFKGLTSCAAEEDLKHFK